MEEGEREEGESAHRDAWKRGYACQRDLMEDEDIGFKREGGIIKCKWAEQWP